MVLSPPNAPVSMMETEPDVSIFRLVEGKLIEGWDPPAAWQQLPEEFKHKLRRRAVIGAIKREKGGLSSSRTELDSHANMIVVERHCFIISRSGKVIDVSTFAEAAGSLSQVPIVNAAIAYDCPWSAKTYILIVWNALYVGGEFGPSVLREAGLIVNECPKQHRPFGEATEDDHTIQHRGSGLKIAMRIRSTFSYFETQKPTEDDFDVGVPVLLTPESAEWDPYDQLYAEREVSLMNWKGEIDSPYYEHLEMIEENNYPSFASVIGQEEMVNRKDLDADITAIEAQDVNFINEDETTVVYKTAKVAEAALKPCSIQEETQYNAMPFRQDQVGTILSSVSNTLDPVTFANALVNDAAASMMKMSIRSTTAHPPDEFDDLWGDEPWHVIIDLNDLEESLDILESNLSKIWSIDLETAKGTIDITTQYLKHEGSDHLSRC